MADTGTPATPPAPETGTTDDPKTPVTPPAPATNNEAAELRKQLEQAQMRARQLENEAAARQKQDDEAKQKQLEDQEEYRKLYESEREKRERLESDRQREQRDQELTQATVDIFKDYPANVVELAQTAGIALSDDSPEAKDALKAKLDKFKETVAPTAAAGSTNPYVPTQQDVQRDQLVAKAEDGSTPMALASARGDNTPTFQYIRTLSAVQQMRKDAGLAQ